MRMQSLRMFHSLCERFTSPFHAQGSPRDNGNATGCLRCSLSFVDDPAPIRHMFKARRPKMSLEAVAPARSNLEAKQGDKRL